MKKIILFLDGIAHKFPADPNRWPCRYDFWLWVFILLIPVLNKLITGMWFPR
jgi:hypothetical protein